MAINEQVFEYIKLKGKATPLELSASLKVSQSSISKSLASLITSSQIVKTEQGRNVFYSLKPVGADLGVRPQLGSTPTAAPATQILPDAPQPVQGAPGAEPFVQAPPALTPASVSARASAPVAPPASTERLGQLEFWYKKLGVDGQAVRECHNDMYQYFFRNPYGIYRVPWGLGGKALNVILWVLALAMVWLWKTRKGVAVKLIGFAIVGGVIYFLLPNFVEKFNSLLPKISHDSTAASQETNPSKEQFNDPASSPLINRLNVQTQQTAALQNQLDQKNQQLNAQAQDHAALQQEMASLKEQFTQQLKQQQQRAEQLEGQIQQMNNKPVDDHSKEIQSLHQAIEQLNNQNQNITQQLNAQAQSFASLQSQWKVEQEQLIHKGAQVEQLQERLNVQAALQQKMDEVIQENKRLNDRFLNEQSINLQLESKLKAVLAQNTKGTTERILSIKFDENGDMIK